MRKISTALAGAGPETRAFLSNHYRRVEVCHSNLTNRRNTFVTAVLDDVLVAEVGHGSGHSSVTVINQPPLCSEGQTVEKHFTTVLEFSLSAGIPAGRAASVCLISSSTGRNQHRSCSDSTATAGQK